MFSWVVLVNLFGVLKFFESAKRNSLGWKILSSTREKLHLTKSGWSKYLAKNCVINWMQNSAIRATKIRHGGPTLNLWIWSVHQHFCDAYISSKTVLRDKIFLSCCVSLRLSFSSITSQPASFFSFITCYLYRMPVKKINRKIPFVVQPPKSKQSGNYLTNI